MTKFIQRITANDAANGFAYLSDEEQRANRLKLADILERRITDKQFDMETWADDCGTVGCALGIAALSGEFEGLGWNYDLDIVDGYIPDDADIFPVVGGKLRFWHEVGTAFFGYAAYHDVFTDNLERDRVQVAAQLRAI